MGRPKAERERAPVERMVRLSRENPRYGYRRVRALLRREGWLVNKKRVHRLWRKEGLKVPVGKQRKRLRLAEGGSENGCIRKRAGHRDHVWSYDFVMDETEDGRRLKMMPVVDEHTRECLAIEVERCITAEDVIGSTGAPVPPTRRSGVHPLGQRSRIHSPSTQAVVGAL